MKNLIENNTDDFVNDYEKSKDLNAILKVFIVVLITLLIWQSNNYSNYKKLAESKAERDLASINGYKELMK